MQFMAENDKHQPEPPMSPAQRQQMGWFLDGPVWDTPQPRRNLNLEAALLSSQEPPFVPTPPPNPPPSANLPLTGSAFIGSGGGAGIAVGAPPADALGGDFREQLAVVRRSHADLHTAIDRLERAVADQRPGIGHNQGPPISFEELHDVDDRLLALLKEEGRTVNGADAIDPKPLIEQAEKAKRLSGQIFTWLGVLALGVVKLGAGEVAKDLTAPLWQDVAHRLADLSHAIEVLASLLPPL
jgi:hypothetical protein